MDGTRLSKVSRQIQKDLGEMFQRQSMALFQGRMITVTTVRVSPDLGVEKVYVSIFPAENREAVLALVRENARTLRQKKTKKVRHQLRVVPELAFFLDDSLDYIENIDRLLKQ